MIYLFNQLKFLSDKKKHEELRKLISEKYLIQRKIDSIIEKLYY